MTSRPVGAAAGGDADRDHRRHRGEGHALQQRQPDADLPEADGLDDRGDAAGEQVGVDQVDRAARWSARSSWRAGSARSPRRRRTPARAGARRPPAWRRAGPRPPGWRASAGRTVALVGHGTPPLEAVTESGCGAVDVSSDLRLHDAGSAGRIRRREEGASRRVAPADRRTPARRRGAERSAGRQWGGNGRLTAASSSARRRERVSTGGPGAVFARRKRSSISRRDGRHSSTLSRPLTTGLRRRRRAVHRRVRPQQMKPAHGRRVVRYADGLVLRRRPSGGLDRACRGTGVVAPPGTS